MTIPLARRGHTLTGIDFTSPFIAEARAAAGDLPITFLERDMRELADLSGFDAALNWWGSFGYFDDVGDEALAAGGLRRRRGETRAGLSRQSKLSRPFRRPCRTIQRGRVGHSPSPRSR